MNPRTAGDDGFTMLEVLVAMLITSVVSIVFIGATVHLNALSRANDAQGRAQAGLGRAFVRLDGTLRYASEIVLTSASELRFVTGTTDTRTTGPEALRCYRVVLDPGRRSLVQTTRLPGGPAVESVLATEVALPPGGTAFTVAPRDPDGGGQSTGDNPVSVTVTLRSDAATGADREITTRFVAPNTARGPRDGGVSDCIW